MISQSKIGIFVFLHLILCNPSTEEKLSVYMMDMNGAIPDSLYNLSKLEVLFLQSNKFGGSIKSEIGNMTELTKLMLYGNQFTGTLPSELGLCEKLGEYNVLILTVSVVLYDEGTYICTTSSR